jgi:hypothetical protein
MEECSGPRDVDEEEEEEEEEVDVEELVRICEVAHRS